MTRQSLSEAFLQLIEESLAASPERGEFWMMRFDALKSLGYKTGFGKSVVQALGNEKISRQLDWSELRTMWNQIAPGEPFPDGTERQARPAEPEEVLPDLELPAKPAAARAPAPLRRFKDIAQRIAGPELAVLAKAYAAIAARPAFLDDYVRKTAALLVRPTPLEFSERLSRATGPGMRVYLKREDRRRVPAEREHAAAQCYIGALMGKTQVVTGNDVDAHAREAAAAAPFFGMHCTIVVRPEDFQGKPQLVDELRNLGAKVEAAPAQGMIGTDPREGAVHRWKRSAGNTHLVLSLGMAPQPHTAMANAFQGLVGREAESQYVAMASLLKRPRSVVAAVGSEADSIGFVLPTLNRREIPVVYAEPEPGGVACWRPSARLASYNGQIREHAWLRGVGRIQYVAVSDADARACQAQLAVDGIKAALEDSRAVALTLLLAQGDPTPRDFVVLVG